MNRIFGVSVDFIDGFNESARSTFPDEFICFHRECDGVITEMILVPGSVYGDSHSFINDWMSPVDLHKSGTAHSHPGYFNDPSDADLDFFSHFGGIHFITCQPYDRKSWRAYDSCGRRIHLDLVF
jgi:proteasome lid subunit RPN8/RPN11